MSDRSISFEVFSDDFPEMERQALEIASWGPQVYVKIPITNTRGASSLPLIRRLADRGVKLNVTAMMTVEQTGEAVKRSPAGRRAICRSLPGASPTPGATRCRRWSTRYR
ncbi:MAG: transaldolase family protein [Bryobacterales bacterium]